MINTEKLTDVIVAYKEYFRLIGRMKNTNGRRSSIFKNTGTSMHQTLQRCLKLQQRKPIIC